MYAICSKTKQNANSFNLPGDDDSNYSAALERNYANTGNDSYSSDDDNLGDGSVSIDDDLDTEDDTEDNDDTLEDDDLGGNDSLIDDDTEDDDLDTDTSDSSVNDDTEDDAGYGGTGNGL